MKNGLYRDPLNERTHFFPIRNPYRDGRLSDRVGSRPGRTRSQNLFPDALSRNGQSETGKRERSRLKNGRYREPGLPLERPGLGDARQKKGRDIPPDGAARIRRSGTLFGLTE
ncbi:hypothetical protein, partial [Sphingomonas sp. TF3]|uniref:hypothetical protein n=1 Tax=Sphingomonas sp. TF3 TaxID=2495580 RepID=UPI001C8D3847